LLGEFRSPCSSWARGLVLCAESQPASVAPASCPPSGTWPGLAVRWRSQSEMQGREAGGPAGVKYLPHCLENFDRPAAAGRGGSSCALKASQRVSLQPPARHRARGRGWRFAGEVNRKCKAARPEVRLGSNICRCVKRGVEGDPPAQRSSGCRAVVAKLAGTVPRLPCETMDYSCRAGTARRTPQARIVEARQLSVSWLYLLLLLLLLRDCRKEAFRSSGPRRGSEVHQAAQAGISSERIAKGLSSHPRHPSALPLGLQRLHWCLLPDTLTALGHFKQALLVAKFPHGVLQPAQEADAALESCMGRLGGLPRNCWTLLLLAAFFHFFCPAGSKRLSDASAAEVVVQVMVLQAQLPGSAAAGAADASSSSAGEVSRGGGSCRGSRCSSGSGRGPVDRRSRAGMVLQLVLMVQLVLRMSAAGFFTFHVRPAGLGRAVVVAARAGVRVLGRVQAAGVAAAAAAAALVLGGALALVAMASQPRASQCQERPPTSPGRKLMAPGILHVAASRCPPRCVTLLVTLRAIDYASPGRADMRDPGLAALKPETRARWCEFEAILDDCHSLVAKRGSAVGEVAPYQLAAAAVCLGSAYGLRSGPAQYCEVKEAAPGGIVRAEIPAQSQWDPSCIAHPKGAFLNPGQLSQISRGKAWKRALHWQKRALHWQKRALHWQKRALHWQKRALHWQKRALHWQKRALHWQKRALHWQKRALHWQKRALHWQKRALHWQKRALPLYQARSQPMADGAKLTTRTLETRSAGPEVAGGVPPSPDSVLLNSPSLKPSSHLSTVRSGTTKDSPVFMRVSRDQETGEAAQACSSVTLIKLCSILRAEQILAPLLIEGRCMTCERPRTRGFECRLGAHKLDSSGHPRSEAAEAAGCRAENRVWLRNERGLLWRSFSRPSPTFDLDAARTCQSLAAGEVAAANSVSIKYGAQFLQKFSRQPRDGFGKKIFLKWRLIQFCLPAPRTLESGVLVAARIEAQVTDSNKTQLTDFPGVATAEASPSPMQFRSSSARVATPEVLGSLAAAQAGGCPPPRPEKLFKGPPPAWNEAVEPIPPICFSRARERSQPGTRSRHRPRIVPACLPLGFITAASRHPLNEQRAVRGRGPRRREK
uniref:Protein kinase domain-containing protein n=1 Tax=Macrostomum lignano TaxID=282301 RepID=A0A1I8IMK4_9PLAT